VRSTLEATSAVRAQRRTRRYHGRSRGSHMGGAASGREKGPRSSTGRPRPGNKLAPRAPLSRGRHIPRSDTPPMRRRCERASASSFGGRVHARRGDRTLRRGPLPERCGPMRVILAKGRPRAATRRPHRRRLLSTPPRNLEGPYAEHAMTLPTIWILVRVGVSAPTEEPRSCSRTPRGSGDGNCPQREHTGARASCPIPMPGFPVIPCSRLSSVGLTFHGG
jgi:hypothetical protein